jgi:ArsR family transcriptional regulator
MTTEAVADIEVAQCCASVATTPLSEDEAGELAKAFAALADPVRLRLFSMIASVDEVCSCELLEPLARSQPTVSHHTKALADAGLIRGEKRGRWVYWRADPERLRALSVSLRP